MYLYVCVSFFCTMGNWAKLTCLTAYRVTDDLLHFNYNVYLNFSVQQCWSSATWCTNKRITATQWAIHANSTVSFILLGNEGNVTLNLSSLNNKRRSQCQQNPGLCCMEDMVLLASWIFGNAFVLIPLARWLNFNLAVWM